MTERLEATLAAQELAARYVDGCDHRDWDAVLDLFEPDGVFDAADVYGQVMTGREELRGFYTTTTLPVAHHATSIYLTSLDGDSATSRMKMIVLFAGSAFSVDYEWQLRRTDGTWRIARQQIALVGKIALGAK